ncbi:BON domain-containing protein [Ramlibacter pallidus]|uniref:BON domain-containing protein n=1 Tax=Ramlibacter pallidus TaxID=2780087 RepID=A0ABR9S7W0_9BURK|nr:BON domain-containing protein [Ramlibacter pallidus]MBE7369596.1 BON domain-containing protein [Ramlibacter pallidus]
MNKPLGALGAAAAGAVAMYYLDPELGAQRRALLAELVRGGLPGGERRSHGRGRYARRAYHPPMPADGRSDAELRDRIQTRLGRMVSHPRAIRVDVEDGVVHLSGRVLAKEHEGLLEQVRQMPGVQRLESTMSAHDFPHEIASRRSVVPLQAASR